MKEITVKLTWPEINHICALIADNRAKGDYYGNQKQWMDSGLRIVQKLSSGVFVETPKRTAVPK